MIDQNRFTRDEDGEVRPRTDFYLSEPGPEIICPGCEQSVTSTLCRYSYAEGVRQIGQPLTGWHEACAVAKEGELKKLAGKLEAKKAQVKLELESLIRQTDRELFNLLSYEDKRMLVATADLKYHWDQVEAAAQELEDAFNDWETAQPEASNG